jgi:hypothetical protein
MSFWNPTPDEEQEYLRRAAQCIQAADLVLSFKLLTLQRQIDELLSAMREIERDGGDVDAIAETHLEMARRKFHLESKAGRQEYRIEMLQEMFKEELNEGLTV